MEGERKLWRAMKCSARKWHIAFDTTNWPAGHVALAKHKEIGMYNPNTCTWARNTWWKVKMTTTVILVTKFSTYSCLLQRLHAPSVQNGYNERTKWSVSEIVATWTLIHCWQCKTVQTALEIDLHSSWINSNEIDGLYVKHVINFIRNVKLFSKDKGSQQLAL